MAQRWWHRDPQERYWLESTDRDDIGANLKAPLADKTGRDNWRYTLFKEARVGDYVFHYDTKQSAIVAVSRIAGRPVKAPIVWAARGSHARRRGAKPVKVSGYRIPLEGKTFLANPVTLETIRNSRASIQELLYKLSSQEKNLPLYFPFELSGRAIRPLQGYAFKLPRRFVQIFPSLKSGLSLSRKSRRELFEIEVFHHLIEAIEAAAPRYEIAKLQHLRARKHNLRRVARTIFGSRVRGEDWTFHYGGREELQFNIGLDYMPDGSRAFRAGVAFSFELSRSLPDISVLIPKVARFNSWMRENQELVGDLAMWHWRDGIRSEDYLPGPIPASLAQQGTFVFLGHRKNIEAANPLAALQTFDRLLPVYEWVELSEQSADIDSDSDGSDEPPTGTLRLGEGREIGSSRWVSASLRERTLDIFLRHKEIQRRLVVKLRDAGYADVKAEVSIGRRYIDVVARNSSGLWFYEVKTAGTARGCIREAVGQLLEYALWPGATKPDHLVIVGEPSLDTSVTDYLATLNNKFPIPLEYLQIQIDS